MRNEQQPCNVDIAIKMLHVHVFVCVCVLIVLYSETTCWFTTRSVWCRHWSLLLLRYIIHSVCVLLV